MRSSRTSQALFLALALLGCGKGQSGSPPDPPPTSTPPPPPAPAPGTIGAAGGVVSVPGLAEIRFPAGSVPAGTRVRAADAPTPRNDPDFADAAEFVAARDISARALELVVEGSQPTANVEVTMPLGPALLASLAAGRQPGILAMTVNESDLEIASATYEIIAVAANSASSTISFSASPVFFSRQSNGDYLARFVFVFTS